MLALFGDYIIASMNLYLTCIGISVSPFCDFATSYLQRINAISTVMGLICYKNTEKLQKLGSNTFFHLSLQLGS